MTAAKALRNLLVYLGIVFVLSWAWEAVLILKGGLGAAGPLLLMWIPGLAAMALKWRLREDVDGLGWRPRRPRLWLVAYLLPLCVGLVAYRFAWSVGIPEYGTGQTTHRIRLWS